MRYLLLMLCFLATPAWAVEPDEMLEDPVLEERAREISEGLRCLVCRNESIDESSAELARDLRLLVRERLLEGDSNTEVVDYVVDRYGEYVLLTPQASGANWILWLAGPGLALLGLVLAGGFIRSQSRRASATPEALSEAEKLRLQQILDE